MSALVMAWIERFGRFAPGLKATLGPHAGAYTLDRKRIFIIPTRSGMLYGASLLTMLLTAVNYSLALGYGLAFLLLGVAFVSMLHTWRNLAGLTLQAGRSAPVHAGDLAEFDILVRCPRGLERYAIEILVPDTVQPTPIDLHPGTELGVTLPVPTSQRGWHPVPRLQLRTTYPLGLWRAWAWWQPHARLLVWPRLETPATEMPEAGGTGTARQGQGEDDFAAIRPYREGDSPRRMAWKAMARTGGDQLLVTEFEGGSGADLEFDWFDLPPHLDVETRVSRLARWVVDAEGSGFRYRLRLPGRDSGLDAGPAHREACLEALALMKG